jgi:hypothetical protein
MHTKKDVLGKKRLVLLLPLKVTSSVCNIYTKRDVLGTK